MRSVPGVWKAAVWIGLMQFLPATAVHGQGGPPLPPLPPGSPQAAGRQIFATRCASCHGTNAGGGEFAPSILERVPLRSEDELVKLLHNGIPTSGMPPFPDIVDQDRANLISYLRTLKPFWGTAAETCLGHPRRRENTPGHSVEPLSTGYAAFGRRPSALSAAQDGVGRVPGGHVTGRLAKLQRADGGQPLQRAYADYQRQRFPVTAQVDLYREWGQRVTGNSRRRWRA